MKINNPHPARSKLEVEAQEIVSLEDATSVSIAISLKRIADFLTGKPDGSTMDIVQYLLDTRYREMMNGRFR